MGELVGIARLAAESPSLELKRRVQYFELPTRKYLTKCDTPRMPFRWTINPYRGCEFGCKYCYARYAHEFMELRDPMDFERKIYVKHFDAIAFRQELEHLAVGETIAIGTATDPYQPAERRYGHTRSILEVFAKTAGFRLGITTKSDLVARDIDLLKEVMRRHYLSIHMTVTTTDRELARLIEPLAPRPDLRIERRAKTIARGIADPRFLLADHASDQRYGDFNRRGGTGGGTRRSEGFLVECLVPEALLEAGVSAVCRRAISIARAPLQRTLCASCIFARRVSGHDSRAL